MGCDWINGVASYGYSIECNYFSYTRITCENVETLIGDNSSMYDAKDYVSDCWNLFCKNQSDEESLKNVECIFVCGTLPMPCTYETFKYIEYSRFVVGYKLEPGVPLSKLTKLSDQLPNKIAQFVYLFNETDTFADIWKDYQQPEDSININMELVKDVKKIDEVKKEIKGADFVIGCQ